MHSIAWQWLVECNCNRERLIKKPNSFFHSILQSTFLQTRFVSNRLILHLHSRRFKERLTSLSLSLSLCVQTGDSEGISDVRWAAMRRMMWRRTPNEGGEPSYPPSEREIAGGETSNPTTQNETGGGKEIQVTIDPNLLDCSICFEPLCSPVNQVILVSRSRFHSLSEITDHLLVRYRSATCNSLRLEINYLMYNRCSTLRKLSFYAISPR